MLIIVKRERGHAGIIVTEVARLERILTKEKVLSLF